MSDETWTQLMSAIGGTATATITRDRDGLAATIRKSPRQGLVQVQLAGGQGWTSPDPQQLQRVQQGFSWNGRVTNRPTADAGDEDVVDFNRPAQLTSHKAEQGVVPLDVQDVGGDRHSIVHYSTKTYKHTPKGKNTVTRGHRGDHHLTVENAHLLLMAELANAGTLAYLDKTKLEKPDVEAQLSARGMAPIDNLNFYPAPEKQGPEDLSPNVLPLNRLREEAEHPGGAPVDKTLSLQQYLTFIQRALATIPNVAPVYGAKVLATARHMQDLTGWDPATMYLRVGSGDHRHLVRAVMAMIDQGWIAGLVLPPMTLRVFERYGRDKPELPITPDPNPAEWVASASLSKGGIRYNDLESEYVAKHSPKVIQGIRAFIGSPIANADADAAQFQ